MVGMVVVRPVPHHDVGLPIPDLARDHAAIFERRLELAVVDVEHVGRDAENARALLDFLVAALCQRSAGLLEVADVAVGHRDKLHLVPLGGPQRGHACGLELRVVGMRAKGDDAQRARLRLLGVDAGHEHGDEHGERRGESNHGPMINGTTARSTSLVAWPRADFKRAADAVARGVFQNAKDDKAIAARLPRRVRDAIATAFRRASAPDVPAMATPAALSTARARASSP